MGRLFDPLWRLSEATYGWGFHRHVIWDPQTSILRLGIRRHWGAPLALPDGAGIRRGNRTGERRFRSQVMTALQARAAGPVRALATMRARGLDGLMCLAVAPEQDPSLKDTEASSARPSSGTRSAGWARSKWPGAPEPRAVWISRATPGRAGVSRQAFLTASSRRATAGCHGETSTAAWCRAGRKAGDSDCPTMGG